MPLPNLTAGQIAYIVDEVDKYIGAQRGACLGKAVPLNENQKTVMGPFFPTSTLDSTRVLVLFGQRIGNPPFYAQLAKMGFTPGTLPDFAGMAAITFVDTIVSNEPYDNRLLFHELVHVIQYQKLGLAQFAAKYVKGFLSGGSYAAIPLELNAYELDARFNAAPATPFSVAAEVQTWIDQNRF